MCQKTDIYSLKIEIDKTRREFIVLCCNLTNTNEYLILEAIILFIRQKIVQGTKEKLKNADNKTFVLKYYYNKLGSF